MQITCSLKVLLFQFHKGAIRTRLPTKIQPDVSLFQFHKGAIRTDRFNGGLPRAQLFQFHKGAIRTQNKGRCSSSKVISIP